MQFQLTSDFIKNVEQLVAKKDGNKLRELLHELHFADIAELLEELSSDEATYLIKILESELTSEALADYPLKKLLRNSQKWIPMMLQILLQN